MIYIPIALCLLAAIVTVGNMVANSNVKKLRMRIRSEEVGIPISFFVGEERHFGVTTGFDMGGRVVADSYGITYKNISIMEIYPPKPF